jgi:hypothetical protein
VLDAFRMSSLMPHASQGHCTGRFEFVREP